MFHRHVSDAMFYTVTHPVRRIINLLAQQQVELRSMVLHMTHIVQQYLQHSFVHPAGRVDL